MKNQEVESRLNKISNQLNELKSVAQRLETNNEFAQEITSVKKIQQLADQAQNEVSQAKNQRNPQQPNR